MTLKIMVTRRFATSGTTRPTTQRLIQENLILQLWDLVKDEARKDCGTRSWLIRSPNISC
jgi:hypothetical protein